MTAISKHSVMSLLVEMRVNGNKLGSGTGFIAQSRNGPVLVTNRHIVTGRHQETGQPISSTGGIPTEVAVLHNAKARLGEWTSRAESLFDTRGNPRWIEHPTLREKADFVALPLTSLAEVDLHPYDPANPGADFAIGPADVVSVIGFPFGLSAGGALAIWATGFVASEPAVRFGNLPTFLIDCRSRQGQSGSPVIAYRSGGGVAMADGSTAMFSGPVFRFLGIYSGRINSESDLGIVWKAAAIAELLAVI